MINRFLKQSSPAFRMFVYATVFVVGMRAVLTTASFDALALAWSYSTIVVTVVGAWRHGFAKGLSASAAALVAVGILDPVNLMQLFVPMFIISVVLATGAIGAARAMGTKRSQPIAAKPVDDAVVSVAPGANGQDVTAAQVLARFDLGARSQ